jgi:hypothetical protein
MADYRPLLLRAISRLDANTPAARQSVYANARATLEGLLLLQDHAGIPGDEFDRERRALEGAIAIIESRMPGGTARPAGSPVPSLTDGRTSVANESPRKPEKGVLPKHTESFSDIHDDTVDFHRLDHDAEYRMEALAAIAAAVSQEIKDRSR